MNIVGANASVYAGLYVGAAVMFWLAQDDRARVGQIVRLRDRTTDLIDQGGEQKPWNGAYPRIDIMTVSPIDEATGEPVLVSAMPHAHDVAQELALQGAPPLFIATCPRYVLVGTLRGRE